MSGFFIVNVRRMKDIPFIINILMKNSKKITKESLFELGGDIVYTLTNTIDILNTKQCVNQKKLKSELDQTQEKLNMIMKRLILLESKIN